MIPTFMQRPLMVAAPAMLADWERLAKATDAQRRDFYLTYGGIHWSQIDEDLSFEGMFDDNGLNYAAEPEAEYTAIQKRQKSVKQ